MRRLLALAIAVLIVLPAISPLFALSSGGADPSRPACCRRDGKHHCMSADMDGNASSTQSGTRLTAAMVSERCPYGAKALPGSIHPDWTLHIQKAVFAGIVAHPAAASQTESKRRISADRSKRKRGPPSANS